MSDYTFHFLGFPVILHDVPMREVRGELVPKVNANELCRLVLAGLAKKKGPLTGAEVRFIRLTHEKTLEGFGEYCGVSHVAVLKWERKDQEPTSMGFGTEYLIRLLAGDGYGNHLDPCEIRRLVQSKPETPFVYGWITTDAGFGTLYRMGR